MKQMLVHYRLTGRRIAILVGATIAALLIGACDESSGPANPQAPSAIPGLCSAAFQGVSGSGSVASAPSAAATPAPVKLSDCKKDSSNNVTIGPNACGPDVYIDRSFKGTGALGLITINSGGGLAFLHDGSFELETTGIVVNGLLTVGTARCPIGNDNIGDHVTITFLGPKPTGSGEDHSKGIIVNAGGKLQMYGTEGVNTDTKNHRVSWTYLAQPAGASVPGAAATPSPNNTTLELADTVDWQPNDWIVVGTTSYSPFESEFVKIMNVTPRSESATLPAGSTIVLKSATPLVHYHFGGLAPGSVPNPNCKDSKGNLLPASFCDGADKNYGVDERAEVGLITRNIRLTSDTPANDAHWGGELRFLANFGEVSIQGVELEKFGKDQLGSYPIHFHMDGDLTANKSVALVNANSIHHSYNKCMTVHSTQNLTIQNNVCARAVGHLFYEEIGDETGISFLNDLGLGAMSNNFGIAGSSKDFWEGDYLANKGYNLNNNPSYGYDGFKIPDTDDQHAPTHGSCYTANGQGGLNFFSEVPQPPKTCEAPSFYVEYSSGFWLVNPSATLVGNSIGGCQGIGAGYWYVPPSDSNALPRENSKAYSLGQIINVENFVYRCITAGKSAASAPTFDQMVGSNTADGTVTWQNVGSVVHTEKLQPLGLVKNNRAHGCYDGIFGETQFGDKSEQIQPRKDGTNTGKNIIAKFDGFTATRNRDRGIWLRPTWFAFDNARVATNRDDVTLLSSGGNDGNAPGVWALLKDSVIVGLSQNNVDRFGPCPTTSGTNNGCVDKNRLANDELERGYPTPAFNPAGFYIYDGPVRIFHDRFVNFNPDIRPRLTVADQAALDKFVGYPHANKTGPYEGDAAIGWFQNNQSAYPTATTSKELIFENVGLRHQVFTDKVNLGMFDDGDKNTAIIDEDGTLTGFKAVNSSGSPVQNLFPISLNNLPINASNNAVDECLATGDQDAIFEGRPTSLISPGNMGTLEFGALYPARNPDAKCKNNPKATCPTDQTQLITFAKDSTDYGAHQIMTLHGRNGQGLWEPKVTSGFGYTVSAAPADTNQFPNASGKAGIPSVVDVGVGDVVKPGISAAPLTQFYVRLGICYTDQNGNHPAPGNFTITRGYKSYGGNAVNQGDPDLQQYFNFLNQRFQAQHCFNLDDQNRPPGLDNLDPSKGCPANGVTAPKSGTCPTGSTLEANVCVYPVQCTQGDGNCPCPQGGDCGRKSDPSNPITPIDSANTMTPATDIGQLTNADGSPKNLNAFYYDKTSGMLFFYVTQDVPNAIGPSPLGSCSNPPDPTDDPDCPNFASGESYYSCPAQGCITYLVRLNDSSYVPGSSKCNGSDPTAIYQYAAGAFSQPPPPSQNQLVYAENIKNPVKPVPNVSKPKFPHSAAQTAPLCPNPTPTHTPAP